MWGSTELLTYLDLLNRVFFSYFQKLVANLWGLFSWFLPTSVGSELLFYQWVRGSLVWFWHARSSLSFTPLLAGYWSSLTKGNLLLWLTLFCFFVARKVQPFWLAQCWPYAIIRPYQGTEVLDFQLAALQPITRDGSRILLCLKDMKVHIVPFLCSPLSWSII